MSEKHGSIEALTTALLDLTEEIRILTSASKKASAAATANTKPEEDEKPSRSRSTKTKEDDKPATRSRSTKVKVPTVKEISEATKAFLDVDDQDEYEDRKNVIKGIVKHFDAPKMSEIADADRALALRALEAAKAGDNWEDVLDGDSGKEEEDLS